MPRNVAMETSLAVSNPFRQILDPHGQTTLMSFERTIQRYTIKRLKKVEIRNYLY